MTHIPLWIITLNHFRVPSLKMASRRFRSRLVVESYGLISDLETEYYQVLPFWMVDDDSFIKYNMPTSKRTPNGYLINLLSGSRIEVNKRDMMGFLYDRYPEQYHRGQLKRRTDDF